MKRYRVSMLVVVLVLAGCATTREVPTRHVYRFERGGEHYEIVSMSRVTGEGANYLVSREEGTIRMSARDDDQDGVLDAMVTGEMHLKEANAIYTYGVSQARQAGQMTFHLTSRVYTTERAGRHYMIKTYLMPDSSAYNRFFVQGENGAYAVVVVDRDADGTLDVVERGDGKLEVLQQAYEAVLDDGMQAGCVHAWDGRYLVEQGRERTPRPIRVGTEAPLRR